MAAVDKVEPHWRAERAAEPARSYEALAHLTAGPDQLFARLDDQRRLAGHMERPSMMMGGGRMTYDFDTAQGMAVGSHIRMGGTAFGIQLYVDEVVTARDPPFRKIWATFGAPRLIIIGSYEMGFAIAPEPTGSRLRVWIKYVLPPSGFGRLLGRLFAGFYARWCVDRMVSDARTAFSG